MKCVCGQTFEGKFCPYCGRQAPGRIRCGCGCEYDSGLAFCPNCGQVNAPLPSSAPYVPVAGAPQGAQAGYPVTQPPGGSAGNSVLSFLKNLGVGAIVIWVLALLWLLGGYLFPALCFAAGGASISPMLKDKLAQKLNLRPAWMYAVMGVLLFLGLVTLAFYGEESDGSSYVADSGYTQPVQTDYYVGDNVDCGNWSIQVNSVEVDNSWGMVRCNATVTNNTSSDRTFSSGSLFSLDNGGVMDDAWSYEDWKTVTAYASFNTTLYFTYSTSMNKDRSRMTLCVSGSPNQIHLG